MSVDAHELCKRIEATHRQLNYWVNRGYLRCDGGIKGTGNHQYFSGSEIAVAYNMAAMVNAGVAPGVAAKVSRGNCPEYQSLLKALTGLLWRGNGIIDETPE